MREYLSTIAGWSARMNTTVLTLLLTLLVALPVAADQPTLRYKLMRELQLTMEQHISRVVARSHSPVENSK